MAKSTPFVIDQGYYTSEEKIPGTGDLTISGYTSNSDQAIVNYTTNTFKQVNGSTDFMKSLGDPNVKKTILNSTGNVETAFDPNVELSGASVATNADANESSTSPSTTNVNFRYPLQSNGGYDYLLITSYEYEPLTTEQIQSFSLPEAEERILNKKAIGSVALPMHPGISDSNSVDWGADQLNPIQVAGASLAGGLIENLSNADIGAAAQQFISQLKSAATAGLGDIEKQDIISYFAGQAVGANLLGRTGKVINNNLELLFRGPQLRSFNYNFKFTPRDSAEAKEIKNIILFFKTQMAVKRSAGSLFLKTPNVFKLKYIYSQGDQHPFLNAIKLCALTNFNVDYTPEGSYMTYGDGSMTSYNVTMQFSELNPIYADDYDKIGGTGY